MKRYITTAILLSSLLAGCSDSSVDVPADETAAVEISYTTTGYSGSRASGITTDDGWDDFNENSVYSLDLFLVKDDKVTLHWSKEYPDDAPNSTDCHTRHAFVTDDVELSHERIKDSDRIYLVANYPGTFSVEEGSSPALNEVLNADITATADLTLRKAFVMTGEVELTESMKTTPYNINIPLKRVAAKVRINLRDKDNAAMDAGAFTSMMLHCAGKARLSHRYDIYSWNASNRLTAVNSVPAEFIDNSVWESLTDITAPHPAEMVKDGGHVYYTYPTDWYNHKDNYVTKGCTNSSHSAAQHTDPDGTERTDRVIVRGYSAREPIVAERQVYAIVQAPFNGKSYFYKVPVNYRLYKYNDRQCFSEHVLYNEILPLYRADRNHFYDVTAIIDRAGAGTPEEAATNPYFTATIAPMNDGGTFDYIYD